MSFSEHGVTFFKTKTIRGRIARLLLRGAEGVLSVLFIISLAAPMVFPREASAVAGVPSRLSYQGRLTNNTGSPLSGTYCVRYSLYDAVSGGTKLWPSGAPTATSTLVSGGVFNAPIGEMDSLASYDLSANDTEYLNVDVATYSGTCGTFESLAPRQKLEAVAYARVAADVYGTALRTSSTTVKIGAGTGQATPIWLNLDWKNTATTLGAACPTGSVNGSIWYNSSGTRGLACVNNVVVGIDNTNEITNLNITGNTAGTPAAISTGAVSFAGGNNITLSQNGNAVTVSGDYAHDVSFGGNTAGVMAMISTGTMFLAGGNNVTLSQNGNSVTVSAFNQSVQTQNVHNVTLGGNTAGVMAAISSGTMQLAGGNNITLSQNGNSVTISAGAGGGGAAIQGSGTYSQNTGTIQFANSNGVTFGLSDNGVMTASVQAGAAGAPVTYHTFQNRQLGASTTIGPGQNSVWMIPFRIPGNVSISGSSIQLIEALSGTATSAVAATFGQTIRWGLYTNNTSNATRVDSWATGSLTLQIWNSGTSSASWAYNGSTRTSAGTNVLSLAYGTRMIDIPLNSSVRDGLGLFAFAVSTSSAGYNALVSRSHMVMDAPMPLAMGLRFGSATATSIGYVDAGTYSVTSGAMPTSVGLSEIRQISNLVPYFKIGDL